MRSGTPNLCKARSRIGTAGWSVPRQHAHHTAETGSHLERYAQVMNCVEVNSSFYRSHRPETWKRWADSTPEDFKFSVKMRRSITHDAKLDCTRADLQSFLDEISGLGKKLGPVLIQLPPKLQYESARAQSFLTMLRELHEGPFVLEPRHASWFEASVEQVMREYRVARVAADPPKPASVLQAAEPGGWTGPTYYRLHGSPRVYYSQYGDSFLQELAAKMTSSPNETWCIFDNTASGAAFEDALKLQRLLAS